MKKIKWLFAVILVGIVLSLGAESLYATESEGKAFIELDEETIKKYIILFGQIMSELSEQANAELEELEKLEKLEELEKLESSQGSYGEDVWIYVDGVVVNESTNKPMSSEDFKQGEQAISVSNIWEQVDNHVTSITQKDNATNVIIVKESFEEDLADAFEDYIVEDQIAGNIKDEIIEKGGEKILEEIGDIAGNKHLKDKAGDIMDFAGNIGDIVDMGSGIIESIERINKYYNDKDPTTWMQAFGTEMDVLMNEAAFIGTALSPSVSFAVPLALWEVNTMLWEEGMETEEWKQFVAENKDNFPAAFAQAWGEGVVECMEDLPREMFNILTNGYISIEEYEQMTALDFLKAILNQLKPTPGLNVYKPNIYLYADEPLEVQVEFLQEYLLTETIPEYALGWDALVQGDGSLVCQGETHDFLFYESLAEISLFQKDTGWVIYAETREEQLLEVLELYDFNEKETKDFMEFWMEKLEADVDFVMYPQDTPCVDVQMPIRITPVPTQITRIWFGFETYAGQEIESPQVEPIQRDGFTVVEWGGFILDEIKK